MNTSGTSPPGEYKCIMCKNSEGGNTTFSDKDYYERHLGTKKHKRNLRSARKAIYQKGQIAEPLLIEELASASVLTQGPTTQQPLELSDISALNDYKGTREKYRQRNVKNWEEYYMSYVSSVVAYWAVTLTLNPTVRDFKISVNDKNWDCFGDAVVEIEFKDLPEKVPFTTRYAIQFKHIASNVKSVDSFQEGRFNFEDIVRRIGKIEGASKEELERTRFIVYTTAAPEPSLDTVLYVDCCLNCFKDMSACQYENHHVGQQEVYVKALSMRRNLVLNTSEDNETIYRFFQKASRNNNRVSTIYVYSCQKKWRDFPGAIEETVCNSFGVKQVEIARDLIKYIEKWEQGQCGGFYKLNKEDILVKLGQLLLAPFKVISKSQIFEDPADRFAIWIQAIKSVDITLLKPSSDLSKLLEPFSLLVEQQLSAKINTTHDTVTIGRTKEQDDTKTINNPILRAFLLEETVRGVQNEFPLEKAYLIFWKAGLMPLILQVKNESDREYVFQVVSVLKNFGFTRRYLVQTTDNSVQISDNKTLKPLSIFANLGDISDKLGPHLLDNIRIGITETFSISLLGIERCDQFFKKTICPSELFDMILGKYVFKPSYYATEEGEDTKLVLDTELMAKLKREIEARGEPNNVLVRERTRNDVLANNWLRGVDPDMFV